MGEIAYKNDANRARIGPEMGSKQLLNQRSRVRTELDRVQTESTRVDLDRSSHLRPEARLGSARS